MAFLIGLVLSGPCWADSIVEASYRGGTVSRQNLDTQRLYGKAHRQERTQTTDVEAIVLRRFLADRLDALPSPVRMTCNERQELHGAQLAALALKRRVSDHSRPEAAVVREYYDQHLESFRRPRQWRLLNIFLRAPEGSSEDERLAARNRLQHLRSRIQDGEDFATLARSESESPTAIRGGRMGFVSTSQLLPTVADEVKRLEPGDVSEIIETEDGFTILRCVEIYPARILPFEDVRERIATRLKRATFENSWGALNRTIRRRLAPLVYVDSAGGGRDGDAVLRVRTSGRAARVSRAGYLYWAANRGMTNPSTQPIVEHNAALRELALVYGRADEAQRRGVAVDASFRDRLEWEKEHTAAECVMDYELRAAFRPPTEAEVSAAYSENRDKLIEPVRRDLVVLRVDIAQPDPQALFRKLQRLATEVRGGITSLDEAFSTLTAEGHDARLESLLGVPPNGIDTMGRGVAEAITAAGGGKISGPIQEKNQLILIRVVEVHPSRQLTLEEATPRIQRYLERASLREARRAIEAEILADQEIVIH